jgi:hypothetical protein
MSDETVLFGTPPPEEPPPPSYPVHFNIDAPPEVGRLSTAFRVILLIPLAFALYLVSNAVIVGFHWITVLVRGRPVGWVFDVIVAVQRFTMRIVAYAFLTTDQYPPFDGEYPVTYDVDQPERIQRKQIFFWKTFASIPHFIVLVILWFAVVVCLVIAWFAILFTGRFPLGLRGFVIGWLRWLTRVNAYWMSLRDEFPPFSMSEESGPATGTAHAVSGIGGFVLAGGAVAAIVVAMIATSETKDTQVAYSDLLGGRASETLEIIDVEVTLLGAIDPYEFTDGLFVPEEDERYVAFGVDLFNLSGHDQMIEKADFELEDTSGEDHDAFIISFGDSQGPVDLEGENGTILVVIFAIPEDEDPAEFRFEPQFLQKARFEITP